MDLVHSRTLAVAEEQNREKACAAAKLAAEAKGETFDPSTVVYKKSTKGMRWSESVKRLFATLKLQGGTRLVTLLQNNIGGPSHSTIKRLLRKAHEQVSSYLILFILISFTLISLIFSRLIHLFISSYLILFTLSLSFTLISSDRVRWRSRAQLYSCC